MVRKPKCFLHRNTAGNWRAGSPASWGVLTLQHSWRPPQSRAAQGPFNQCRARAAPRSRPGWKGLLQGQFCGRGKWRGCPRSRDRGSRFAWQWSGTTVNAGCSLAPPTPNTCQPTLGTLPPNANLRQRVLPCVSFLAAFCHGECTHLQPPWCPHVPQRAPCLSTSSPHRVPSSAVPCLPPTLREG